MPSCRYCGHEGAYDSGFSVECPNTECAHYDQEQRKEYFKWAKTQKMLKEYLQEESSDPDTTPVYHWGVQSPILPEDS